MTAPNRAAIKGLHYVWKQEAAFSTSEATVFC